MKLIITESQFKDFLRYSILGEASTILLEDQESKSYHKAVRLVMNKFGYDNQEAYNYIKDPIKKTIYNLKTDMGAKYILGVTRLWLNGELNDGQSRSQINTIIEILANDSQLYNDYSQDLNGLSLQKLVNTFSHAIKGIIEKDKQKLASKKYNNNSRYKIVKIDNIEQSSKYAQYCNWCITQEQYAIDEYTHKGVDQFYFCLRNGFENEPVVKGPNCPLDSYGLSMIAVCVDENGRLSSCTTRWNYSNGGTMHALTTEQISELIGRNFYEVFKPNDKWKTVLERAMTRLKNGENPKNIFDNIYYSFVENINTVELNGKYNLIDKQGNILFKQWFDSASIFINGCVVVSLNDKYNFIDKQGNYLFKQWFDFAESFRDGYAVICLNDKYNFIDRQGNYLFKQWFDECSRYFQNDNARAINS